MARGMVTFWNRDRGFGFAAVDGDDYKIFIHATALVGVPGSFLRKARACNSRLRTMRKRTSRARQT